MWLSVARSACFVVMVLGGVVRNALAQNVYDTGTHVRMASPHTLVAAEEAVVREGTVALETDAHRSHGGAAAAQDTLVGVASPPTPVDAEDALVLVRTPGAGTLNEAGTHNEGIDDSKLWPARHLAETLKNEQGTQASSRIMFGQADGTPVQESLSDPTFVRPPAAGTHNEGIDNSDGVFVRSRLPDAAETLQNEQSNEETLEKRKNGLVEKLENELGTLTSSLSMSVKADGTLVQESLSDPTFVRVGFERDMHHATHHNHVPFAAAEVDIKGEVRMAVPAGTQAIPPACALDVASAVQCTCGSQVVEVGVICSSAPVSAPVCALAVASAIQCTCGSQVVQAGGICQAAPCTIGVASVSECTCGTTSCSAGQTCLVTGMCQAAVASAIGAAPVETNSMWNYIWPIGLILFCFVCCGHYIWITVAMLQKVDRKYTESGTGTHSPPVDDVSDQPRRRPPGPPLATQGRGAHGSERASEHSIWEASPGSRVESMAGRGGGDAGAGSPRFRSTSPISYTSGNGRVLSRTSSPGSYASKFGRQNSLASTASDQQRRERVRSSIARAQFVLETRSFSSSSKVSGAGATKSEPQEEDFGAEKAPSSTKGSYTDKELPLPEDKTSSEDEIHPGDSVSRFASRQATAVLKYGHGES